MRTDRSGGDSASFFVKMQTVQDGQICKGQRQCILLNRFVFCHLELELWLQHYSLQGEFLAFELKELFRITKMTTIKKYKNYIRQKSVFYSLQI